MKRINLGEGLELELTDEEWQQLIECAEFEGKTVMEFIIGALERQNAIVRMQQKTGIKPLDLDLE